MTNIPDEPSPPAIGRLEQREAAVAQGPGGLRGAAVRSASVAGVTNIVVQVIQLVVYLFLARLAAPAVFGVFAAGSILLSVGEIFTESGMTAALLQRRANVDAAAATVLASTFVGGVALALAALALSPLVGLYFHSHTAGLVSAALAPYLIINGLTGVPGTLLQRRFALRRWLLEPLAMLTFGICSGLGLAYGLGVWGLVIGWYAQTIFRAAGFWLMLRWKPQLRLISWSMWRELSAYARHILASVLLGEVQRVSTTALVGRFLGPADLGQFRFGWRLSAQATAPLVAANAYTIQPALVRLSTAPDRARSAVLTSFRIVSLVAFPLGAVFIPLGSVIAAVLLGDQWLGVGPILTALAPMAMATAMISVPNEIFKATGRPYVLPRIHALWTVTSITFMLALIHFGSIGVAWAWSASTTLTALYSLSGIRGATEIPRRELAATIAPPLFSALTAAGVLLLVDRFAFGGVPHSDPATVVRLVVEIILGAVLYVSLMMVVARRALREFVSTVAAIAKRSPRPPVAD